MTPLEILTKAKNEGYALGAFNAGSLEVVKAIAQASFNQQSPLILETSAGEIEYLGMKNFLSLVENYRQENNLEILTNLDHGPGLEECQEAIDKGYNLIHFDGSALPYEENVKITKILVEQAHQKGLSAHLEMNRFSHS